jgi:Na+/proline symporter
MMMNDLLSPTMAVIILLAILAAIMSTVSGMILSISSILVRDVWIRFFDPKGGTAERMATVSRVVTVLVVAGSLAFVIWGPKTLVGLLIEASGPIMLQVLVVLAGGLYWRRATKAGAIVSMLASEAFLVLLWTKTITMPALGIHNGVWAMLLGVVLYVGVSLATQPPPEEVVRKFFDLYDEPTGAPARAEAK